MASSYYSLVCPETPLKPASIEVHGLRLADFEQAPSSDIVARALADAIGDRLVVAHAAWVEASFLRALELRSGVPLPRPSVDTAALSRRAGVVITEPRHDAPLELVARSLSLPVYSPHHALGDALTTAVVFMALAHQLGARNGGRPASVADVVRAAR
jgi:DNA polymerase-3 subunit epsilon